MMLLKAMGMYSCSSRHVAVSPQTCETTDKFRIHMFEDGTQEVRNISLLEMFL